MIAGIGSDLVDARRIERMLARFGERMERKLFSDAEIVYARSRSDPAAIYAKRFAAKEAFAKALGSGLRGVSWRDIEVARDELGCPSLLLHGPAREALTARALGRQATVHLSLSDDHPYALAFVVIECR